MQEIKTECITVGQAIKIEDNALKIKGFIKKLCYGLAVVAAIGVDYVIVTISERIGYSINASPYFAMLCTVWLVINECISILENLTEIGVPMPVFLIKIAKRLKNSVEEKGDDEE